MPKQYRSKKSRTGRTVVYPIEDENGFDEEGFQVQSVTTKGLHTFTVVSVLKNGKTFTVKVQARTTKEALSKFNTKFPLAVVKKLSCDDCLRLRTLPRKFGRGLLAIPRIMRYEKNEQTNGL